MTEGDETVTVDTSDGLLRLDRWFKRHYPGLGHGRLEKLLRTGRIRVDGKRARSGDRVGPGQAIRIPPCELAQPPRLVRPQPRPADEAMLQTAILYRDEAVIVLDKPPGLAVQGGTATELHVDVSATPNARALCTGSTRRRAAFSSSRARRRPQPS
jgi:23S rRNA pseudouridine955/2504/2580 synthase